MKDLSDDFGQQLRQFGLRDTRPRRLVHSVLQKTDRPLSATDIHDRLAGKANAVTVYRILESFETNGIVHRHPCDGRYTICRLPGSNGHHGFLHCSSCGGIQEFQDDRLCTLEDKIATAHRFQSQSHVSEIIGTCHSCQASRH